MFVSPLDTTNMASCSFGCPLFLLSPAYYSFGALGSDFYSYFRIAAKFFTRGVANVREGIRLLTPMIEERLRMEKEYGKGWSGRPVCATFSLMGLFRARNLMLLVANFFLFFFACVERPTLMAPGPRH
jgi:hypothetical protein